MSRYAGWVDDTLLAALRRAVDAAPADLPLRLHLAGLLLDAGHRDEATALLAAALHQDAGNTDAQRLMLRALTGDPTSIDAPPTDRGSGRPGPPPAGPAPVDGADAAPEFDWAAAEAELLGARERTAPPDRGVDGGHRFGVEAVTLTLADVGGMDEAKKRIEAAFLAPLRNPELRRTFAKSLRGGLLLYGPPGCGKTFLARAMAGELGAGFLSVGIADILDPFQGVSERNLHDAFAEARRSAPCVLFFDEIDALGQRRSQARGTGMRNVVNQLLTELDGVGSVNDGVFVLGATNQPWDVDPALRRPGRFDRTVLVTPPDRDARMSVFGHHLRERPVVDVDLRALANASDGLSGADIAYACEVATEFALLDSIRAGVVRSVRMSDLQEALRTVPVSTSSWFESARNVVMFGDDDGTYRELRSYLKKAKKL